MGRVKPGYAVHTRRARGLLSVDPHVVVEGLSINYDPRHVLNDGPVRFCRYHGGGFFGSSLLSSHWLDVFMHTLAQLRAGELAGLKRLDLSCGLTQFPEEIFTLADTLEVLNLSGNALSSLPDDLHRLTRLRVLFCSDNRFKQLPPCLGRCEQLTMIGFKANNL